MDLDARTFNPTAMRARCVPLSDRRGREVAVVIVKMSYDVAPDGRVTLPAVPSPIRWSDVFAREGPLSSVRYPSDLVEERPGTDVLLAGTARPPKERAITEMDVRLRVGAAIDKTLRVHGPRVYYEGPSGVVPGPPAALASVPLLYELAYGGVDGAVTEPRNPAGVGFAVRRSALVGRAAPQIEDPRDRSAPAGFGPIPTHWAPRSDRAGTHDDTWRRERAPYRPLDFDLRHHSAAPPDQRVDEPLRGDEPVEITGVLAEGPLRFRLPRYAPSVIVTIDRVDTILPAPLDTFLIDTDRGRVELTFRARAPIPRKSQRIQRIRLSSEDDRPDLAQTTGPRAMERGT